MKASASQPNDILDAALDLQTFCIERGWRSCIIGGLAVQRWGEPRFTQDVEGILMRQQRRLNMRQITRELEPLVAAKDSPETIARLKALAKEILKRPHARKS